MHVGATSLTDSEQLNIMWYVGATSLTESERLNIMWYTSARKKPEFINA